VSKYDGTTTTQLQVSAVKQIAGRAGRFRLLGTDGNPGGTVTTLQEADLPYVRRCIAQPYEPLSCAYIGHTKELFTAVAHVVPTDTPMAAVLEAPSHAGRLPLVLRYNIKSGRNAVNQFLDSSSGFSISDRLMLLNAPIPWKDPEVTAVIKGMLQMHQDGMSVKISALHRTRFYDVLLSEEKQKVEKQKAKKQANPSQRLLDLESLHRILVFYLWMHHRHPAIYADYLTAAALKSRVEKVLAWCLHNLSLVKQRKSQPLPSSQPTLPTRTGLSYMTKTELRRISVFG
jgi:ATP-dependent RNA helicase SUPV3L1/SUV3